VRHPSWRLVGAIGYLGFDIAVLWATLRAVGYSPPLAVLILGYIIGYLANLIPIPGAVGVLEGGLAGTLVLYGAPVTEATAGVLVRHAIAFWIPSIGGLLGYRRLRRHLSTGMAVAPRADEAVPPRATTTVAVMSTPRSEVERAERRTKRRGRLPLPRRPTHHHRPPPAPGDPMHEPTSPNPPTTLLARKEAGVPSRSDRPLTVLRRRHLEAHALARLRSLRDGEPVRSWSTDTERTR
jgi:hypothetical protein